MENTTTQTHKISTSLDLLGLHIDDISDLIVSGYSGLGDGSFKFVVDRDSNIIDVLHVCGWMTSLTRKDSHGFGSIIHKEEFHSIRHFNKSGDCDFRYFIPLSIL